MTQWNNNEDPAINAQRLNDIEKVLANSIQKTGMDSPMSGALLLRDDLVLTDGVNRIPNESIGEKEAVSKEYVDSYIQQYFNTTRDYRWRDFTITATKEGTSYDYKLVSFPSGSVKLARSETKANGDVYLTIHIPDKFSYFICYDSEFYYNNNTITAAPSTQITFNNFYTPNEQKYAVPVIANLDGKKSTYIEFPVYISGRNYGTFKITRYTGSANEYIDIQYSPASGLYRDFCKINFSVI